MMVQLLGSKGDNMKTACSLPTHPSKMYIIQVLYEPGELDHGLRM